ncbi:hypothetical protein GOP56_09230 [Brevibacillus sp. 7WMA2]|uniref:hypothetical protein n=1 Tax=Brevibacillus sp. 7WMA2 TaxID=2683193 RepID=UPI0013A72296|nr:hypothetical protein [Brevibacillus sp. 7WMA2]QIC05768.1 hypothetical protein GOP56_09230 [Brevibacillus sp. 7WMA2]
MEVIGIVQTDLNEFSILFEPDKKQKQDQQGKQNGNDQNHQDQDHHHDDDSTFLSFLGGDILQETGNSRDKSQQQQEPQEMVVRIKGIPEGQKATFLQMYQIVTDAQKQGDLEQQLTIVSIENPNSQQNQQGNQQQQQQQDKSKKGSSKDQKNNQKDKNKQQYQ